jgi:phospholipid/cholesterol/gamma-HCH transport system permease protein
VAGEYLGYLSFEAFIRGGREFFQPFDAYYGMTKMIAFGYLITSISCWKGFTTKGGADGVGRSTTSAVVVSCVNILFADYLLAEFLL